MSLAESTRKNYNAGLKNFLDFCQRLDLVAFPLHQGNIILFATELSKTVSVSSINIQLAAIKFTAQKYGYNSEFGGFRRLYLLMRGIKKLHGRKFQKKKRLPITPNILLELYYHLFNSSRPYNDKLMLWAAMLTAFFGFLRISEYTATRAKSFEEDITLCVSDVFFNATDGCDLQLKGSKTDPFRVGVRIKLSANQSVLCPVQSLKTYLLSHPTGYGPLFVFENGSYLTRQSFSATLKSLLNNRVGISTHSFRIGAATTAAARGFPRWLIKSLGRWTSDCFRDYIRIPDNLIRDVSKSLIKDPGNTVLFDPDLTE